MNEYRAMKRPCGGTNGLLTIGGIYDTGISKWGCEPVANEQ
jgi:hypothetical protein